MSQDAQEEFLQKFHDRRMAKHKYETSKEETNKRKADSPSPSQNSPAPQRNIRIFDGDDYDSPEMSFEIDKSDPLSDGEPGPAIETTSTRQTTPFAEKPAQNDGSTFKSEPVKTVTRNKAEQCARITAESERAQLEIEAAGVHVRDFATGYETRR